MNAALVSWAIDREMFHRLVFSLWLERAFNCFPSGAPGLHGSSGKLTGSTSSLNKLAVQGSSSRRSQSSSLLDMGNMSASDLDVADRTKFDKVMLTDRAILQSIYCTYYPWVFVDLFIVLDAPFVLCVLFMLAQLM